MPGSILLNGIAAGNFRSYSLGNLPFNFTDDLTQYLKITIIRIDHVIDCIDKWGWDYYETGL